MNKEKIFLKGIVSGKTFLKKTFLKGTERYSSGYIEVRQCSHLGISLAGLNRRCYCYNNINNSHCYGNINNVNSMNNINSVNNVNSMNNINSVNNMFQKIIFYMNKIKEEVIK